MMTPMKNPHGRQSQISETLKISENFDPNLPNSTPSRKPIKSPSIKSAKSKKSNPKTPIQMVSTPPAAQGRRISSAKKSSGKKQKGLNSKRATAVVSPIPDEADELRENAEKDQKNFANENILVEDSGVQDLEGSTKVRKMRSMMLEEAMSSIPEPGAGRVMHLVKAFERLLSLSKEPKGERAEGKKGIVLNWALPGLQQPPKADETEVSSSSIFSSPEFEDSSEHSSVDSNGYSWGSSTSDGGRRSRRKSADSSERNCNKKLKATSQQPFKLKTEQRGRLKEEHFLKKVKEMFREEEKQRIQIAQGLPWTTDNPECLVKPSIKEPTEPIDLVLHSDVRAVERSEFDLQIAERMSFIEHIKFERERLRKLEEEEEIRRLRRELVPRAQPIPYFDRPFIPKKSPKPQTVPKEPRLHSRPTKTWVMKRGHGQLTE